MLTERELQELLDYKSSHPVLSIYLNTDPALGGADVYKLKLRSMLKEVNFPDDSAVIERYFNHEYDWSGRSVAVFSCAPDNFFRAYPIAVPVRSRTRINTRPHVKPLVDLMDSYGGYGVALVDKQGARFFSFHLGELQEQEGIMGETVRKVKHGGGSRLAGRRGGEADQTQNIAELTERNMRESAAFAAQFFASHNIRRVLIGGTDDNIALFRGHLPKSWQSLIVGSFPSSMTASHAEVMERAMKIGQAAEQKREATLVENIITAAAKGQAASIGLDDTLAAIHENRVHALAITNGFRAPGYRCQSCGYLTAPKMDTCPYCGNPFEEIPDAVELAVRQVLQDGGDVDVLHENEKLKQHGNIGALLRY